MLQYTAIITPLRQSQKLSPSQSNPFLYTDTVDFLIFLPAMLHHLRSLPTAGGAVRHLRRHLPVAGGAVRHLRSHLPAAGGAVRYLLRRHLPAAGGAVRHLRRHLPAAGGAVRHLLRRHLRSLPSLEALPGGAVRAAVILKALMCARLTRFCVNSASVNPRLCNKYRSVKIKKK